jgi:S-adenosylmethionine:tRNA ribosyltransferase-isomerase
MKISEIKNHMQIGDIKIDDYNYSLPDNKIAQFPLEERDSSKLLVYRNRNICKDNFINLANHLDKKCLMVFNNTRVIHARLEFRRNTGAMIEVLCIEPVIPCEYNEMFGTTGECQWWCMVGNLKKWKTGSIEMPVNTKTGETTLTAEKKTTNENGSLVRFTWNTDLTFGEVIEAAGILPLPPYLNRDAVPEDDIRYQTIYSSIEGSVAAPTAGLHFTDVVFGALRKKSIDTAFLTLHIGAGTFKPVKSESIADHEMHTEHFFINITELEKIISKNGSLVAVGTTTVRTIESLYWLGVKTILNPAIKMHELIMNQWEAYSLPCDIPGLTALESLHKWMESNKLSILHSSTTIMIVPGYKFGLVDAIITNFHQPKSTLLLLISAWVGDDWKRIYNFAGRNNFRFLSYGDSSLLFK